MCFPKTSPNILYELSSCRSPCLSNSGCGGSPWQTVAISPSRFIQQLLRQGACPASWASHTFRGVKTEARLQPLRLMRGLETWKGHVAPRPRSQKQDQDCKLNSLSADTWVVSRHCKLLITPPLNPQNSQAIASVVEAVFPAKDSTPTKKGTNKRISPGLSWGVSAAHFLLSESECHSGHQAIQES